MSLTLGIVFLLTTTGWHQFHQSLNLQGLAQGRHLIHEEGKEKEKGEITYVHVALLNKIGGRPCVNRVHWAPKASCGF